MAKKQKQVFDNLSPADLNAFKRTEWFETTKLFIQIFLMSILALALTAFLALIILAGVSQNILPDIEGVRALTKLFVEISGNAKTVGLFALGFFFREYLAGKNIKP